uniref:Uncharacterized protein n=1 Tax=Avena sativa TaxID=4498 RepID=A0ACD6AEK0_AVESA
MGSIKGVRSLIMCVLILGLVLEQVQVEGNTCCKDDIARNCYNVCLIPGTPTFICANVCRCIITREECPNDYPKLQSDPDAGTPNAIEFCNTGCISSICDNMNKAYRGEKKENDKEFCSIACGSFCNKITVSTSVAA